MGRVFPAPLAVFLQFQFALHCFFVFAGPVVNALARATLKFNKIWLWHMKWFKWFKSLNAQNV